MEFPDLGSQCAFLDCKQLDFLPVECDKCKLLFCTNHSVDYQHNCSQLNEVSHLVEWNEASGSPKSYKCSLSNCRGRELTPVVCEKCEKQFCLKHRLPHDHSCPSVQKLLTTSLTPKEKVTKIIGKELSKEKPSGRTGRRSTNTSSKVVEMKLKMKAKGESRIPVIERTYVNVHAVDETMPMFFSHEYSIGKIIDLIAKECSLKNENHVTNSPKIRIFDGNDVIIPTDLKLSEVLSSNAYDVTKFGDMFVKYI